MPGSSQPIEVYLEVGRKRVFAGVLDWPGWCRSGRDEDAAREALLAYAPRYAKVFQGRRLGFTRPKDMSMFKVVERLTGDASTDFGAPGQSPKRDSRPVNDAELSRMQTLLQACWAAFDAAAVKATGRELRKGPRGGGRDLNKMIRHVLESEAAYLAQIGTRSRLEDADPKDELARIRQASLGALASAARAKGVPTGPRGGVRWSPRYYVRRSAWHVLDHAWEIEDRAIVPAGPGCGMD